MHKKSFYVLCFVKSNIGIGTFHFILFIYFLSLSQSNKKNYLCFFSSTSYFYSRRPGIIAILLLKAQWEVVATAMNERKIVKIRRKLIYAR
jgi:hypothetical protein